MRRAARVGRGASVCTTVSPRTMKPRSPLESASGDGLSSGDFCSYYSFTFLYRHLGLGRARQVVASRSSLPEASRLFRSRTTVLSTSR